MAEAEWDVYSANVKIEPDVDAIRETILEAYGYMDSGFTLYELSARARTLNPTQPEVLFTS